MRRMKQSSSLFTHSHPQITDFLSDYYAIVESAYKSTTYDDDVLLIKYYLDGHTFAAGRFP